MLKVVKQFESLHRRQFESAQEVFYRGTSVASANRLWQKDHSYYHDGSLGYTTLRHWDASGVFLRREYVRSLHNEDGLVMMTDYYANDSGVDDTAWTSKFRSLYLYDHFNPTGYVQVMRETYNNTFSGTVFVRSHSKCYGHERVSEKTTIAAQPNAPQTYFFVHDGHGSTRALTDGLGAAVERYDYDAFGNAIGFEPANALTRFLYCGELYDHKLGWTYLRARYYDPKVGRFNRLDPFFGNQSDPQSLHKYTYCHGDPVNHRDPSGMSLTSTMVTIGIGAVIGSSIGGALGSLIGSKMAGKSWYFAGISAADAFIYPYATAITIIATPITLVFAFFNAFFDCRALYNKWTYVGNGGKDATHSLSAIRDKVIKHWKSLSFDQKIETMLRLHNPVGGLSLWDITQLVENKDKWTEGIDNPAPETLTYESGVYPTAEVNYLLWGLINRLAFKDGVMLNQTCWSTMFSKALIYRSVFGSFISVDQYFRGTLNMFETTYGKLAWVNYGWNWGDQQFPPVPSETKISKATPSTVLWSEGLGYNFGGQSGSV